MADSTLISRAASFAVEKHGRQMYGKYPYSYHLIEVADNVKEMHRKNLFGFGGLDKNVLIQIAYLHDVLEDTDVEYIELCEEFGIEISSRCLLLSKKENPVYEEYIKKVMSDPYSHAVKIADTYANLHNSWKAGNIKRIKKYTDQLNLLLGDINES